MHTLQSFKRRETIETEKLTFTVPFSPMEIHSLAHKNRNNKKLQNIVHTPCIGSIFLLFYSQVPKMATKYIQFTIIEN
jgi:hypothetical protein